MPYATQRDRTPTQLETTGKVWPAPPLNVFMRAGPRPGMFDLNWDSPAELAANAEFAVLGVNIYRSLDSEYGPFDRITELPVGANFWRDETDTELISDEDVSDRFVIRGAPSAGESVARYVFQVLHRPIVAAGSQGVPTNNPADVAVFVDGVPARVLRINGRTGEVEIDPLRYPDVARQTYYEPVVPGPDSKVTCSYRWNRSLLRTDLFQRIFYRFSTVGHLVSLSNPSPSDLVETPLEYSTSTSRSGGEPLDWMWREAIRRNRWILGQGGERVKAFIHKHAGVSCPCRTSSDGTGHHKQPISDCPTCYGTGWIGGYEGPYDILIAPDDAERRITQKDSGRTGEHSYEVFTGPQPVLSQRDFIVKIDGDHYSIGPVRRPSVRDTALQQHFTIGHLDEKDIRYTVPLYNPTLMAANRIHKAGPEWPAGPEITDKPNIPDERELRGRTPVWEDIVY